MEAFPICWALKVTTRHTQIGLWDSFTLMIGAFFWLGVGDVFLVFFSYTYDSKHKGGHFKILNAYCITFSFGEMFLVPPSTETLSAEAGQDVNALLRSARLDRRPGATSRSSVGEASHGKLPQLKRRWK